MTRKNLPIAFLILSLVACATTGKIAHPEKSITWPPEGDSPHIAYLTEFRHPADLGIRDGVFKRIVAAVKGQEEKSIIRPYGIAADNTGNLFIVDNGYQAIHVFNLARKTYTRFPKEHVDDFDNPVNIATSNRDRIYVSDSSSGLVHVFDGKTFQHVTSFGNEYLDRPTGLAVNEITGELLVLDTKNSTLFVFNEESYELIRVVGDPDSAGSDDPVFHFPTNISVTASGDVLVSDSLNFRVQKLDSGLKVITEFGDAGNTPGDFSRPKGLASDSSDNVYVIDALFDNVQIFSPAGALLLAFGGPGNGPGQFWLPNSIFIDNTDKIYISDGYNQRIQIFQLRQRRVSAP